MTAVESLKREVVEEGEASDSGGTIAPVMVNPIPLAEAETPPGADGASPEHAPSPDHAPSPNHTETIDDTARLSLGHLSAPMTAVVIPLPIVAARETTPAPVPAPAPEPETGEGEEAAETVVEIVGMAESEEAAAAEGEEAPAEEPVNDEPLTDEPVSDEAPTEEPAAHEPGIEEPGVDEPAPPASEAATTVFAAAEPATAEPVSGEPASQESSPGEPSPDEADLDEPDLDGPDLDGPDLDATPAETARARLATLFVVPDRKTEEGAEDKAPPTLPAVPKPNLARLRGSANPLMTAAAPVLEQVRLLRDAEAPEDVDALGFELTRLLARYEEDANRADLGPGAIQVGRFALAATLDDVLRTRPWAGRCGWLRQGLAASGPERFFDLMRVMLNKPARHQGPLELFYACLSLGFEGRFRDKPRGVHDLNRIRDQLHRVLRRLGEAPDRTLSPTVVTMGSSADPQRIAAARYRPPPPIVSPRAAAPWLAALCLSFYFVGAWWLSGKTEPLVERLAATLPEREVATARPTALPPMAGPELPTRISGALGDDIRAGAVEMLAGTDGALVLRLSGGAVFPAGSDAVRAFYRAVIDRMGKVLAGEQGRIVVVAHSDSWALPTERFPTARALTEARAEAVRALLERHLGGIRLSAEGRGDGEPIDSNDTPAGRAANRRVDIRLYP